MAQQENNNTFANLIDEKSILEQYKKLGEKAAKTFSTQLSKYLQGDKSSLQNTSKMMSGFLTEGLSIGLQSFMGPAGGMITQMVSPFIEKGIGSLMKSILGPVEPTQLELLTNELVRQQNITQRIKTDMESLSDIYNHLPQFSNEFDSAVDKLQFLQEEMKDYQKITQAQDLDEEERLKRIIELKERIALRERNIASLQQEGYKGTEVDIKKKEIAIEKLSQELMVEEKLLELQREEFSLQQSITQERYKQLELQTDLTDQTVAQLQEKLSTSFDMLMESIHKGLGSEMINENLKTFADNLKNALLEGIISEEEYQSYLSRIQSMQDNNTKYFDSLKLQAQELDYQIASQSATYLETALKSGLNPSLATKALKDAAQMAEDFTSSQVESFFSQANDELSIMLKNLILSRIRYQELNQSISNSNESLMDTALLSEAFAATEDERIRGAINRMEREIKMKKELLHIAEAQQNTAEQQLLQQEINQDLNTQLNLISDLISYMEKEGFLENEIYDWRLKSVLVEKEITREMNHQNQALNIQDRQLAALIKQRQRLLMASYEGDVRLNALSDNKQAILSRLYNLGYTEDYLQQYAYSLPGFASGGISDSLYVGHPGEAVFNRQSTQFLKNLVGEETLAQATQSVSSAKDLFNPSISKVNNQSVKVDIGPISVYGNNPENNAQRITNHIREFFRSHNIHLNRLN